MNRLAPRLILEERHPNTDRTTTTHDIDFLSTEKSSESENQRRRIYKPVFELLRSHHMPRCTVWILDAS